MATRFDQHSGTDINPIIRRLSSTAALLPEEQQAIMALPITLRTLAPGQSIVREGDRPSQCCAVLEGFAYRHKVVTSGKTQIFSFHVSGDIPDVLSLYVDVMDHDLS